MILFRLTMPHAASWNGRWSGEGRIYAKTRKDREVPKQYWGKDFHYRWEDGWGACVSVEHMDSREAQKIMRKSVGFSGYDWMIKSIIERGYIVSESDLRNGDA